MIRSNRLRVRGLLRLKHTAIPWFVKNESGNVCNMCEVRVNRV